MSKLVFWIALSLAAFSHLQAQMYDPFRKTAKPSSAPHLMPPPPMMAPSVPPTVVSAVMNGKAYINGVWYRVGDRINQHEITYIDKNFVGLKEGNRLKMIGVGSSRRVLGTKDVP